MSADSGPRHGTASGRRRAPRKPVRLSRRGRVLAWAGGVVGVLLVATMGAGVWVYQELNSNISSADLDGRLGAGRPTNLSPGSKNVLVVGSDSRAGDNAKYGKGLETMQSDTLMLLHLSANREWATVASFPRDSWVTIAACDKGNGAKSKQHKFKINEAFAIGGISGDIANAAACTIKTVEMNTGLRVDHFISVDFQGFKGMVNALDGIEVCPKQAIHDKKAQLDIEAGCQTVKDEQALGYVRTRYSVGDGSDIGRIGRQQEFMQALADKAQQKLSSPGDLYGFLDSATKSLTTDKALAGLKPLYEFASALKDVPKNRLTFVTVPNYPREADVPTDRANVVWQYPQAGGLFDALAHDREVDKEKLTAEAKNRVTAKSVRVRVLNGTGRPGRAAEVAEQLRKEGFNVIATGNAASTKKSVVTYPKRLEDQAAVLAGRAGVGKPEEDNAKGTESLTFVVGPDFAIDR